MEVINDLLQIKKFREQKAEVALAKASHALEAAVAALNRSRDDLSACRSKCDRRQRALYADLCSRLVVRGDIDAVLAEVDIMKQEISRAEEVVEVKKQQRDQASERVDEARKLHQLAMRGREKFTELADQAGLVATLVAQRKEETELEEVRIPAMNFPAGAWEDSGVMSAAGTSSEASSDSDTDEVSPFFHIDGEAA